jgi:hypothetical protein
MEIDFLASNISSKTWSNKPITNVLFHQTHLEDKGKDTLCRLACHKGALGEWM